MSNSIPVAILCGGKGTRIARGDEDTPKPLVDVGGKPILWHVMALYAAQGFSDFVLLTGWQADRVAAAAAAFDEVQAGEWSVIALETGEETATGGRVSKARARLDSGTFALTYADGVADIDLAAELAFHRSHGGLSTLTVTRPASPWGEARIDNDGRVSGFVEKPQLENWINGGFMFLEPGAFDFIGEADILEERPLRELATAGELYAYKHEGFWDCMDTFKDALVLNELCADGTPPWLRAVVSAGASA
jgi:glucose-1-phosphate cytidylyltransferase